MPADGTPSARPGLSARPAEVLGPGGATFELLVPCWIFPSNDRVVSCPVTLPSRAESVTAGLQEPGGQATLPGPGPKREHLMLRPNHVHARPVSTGRIGRAPARRRRGNAALAVTALLGTLVVWGCRGPTRVRGRDATVGCNGPGNTGSAADLQAIRDAIVSPERHGRGGHAHPDRQLHLLLLPRPCTPAGTPPGSGRGVAGDRVRHHHRGPGATIQRDVSTTAPFRMLFIGADPTNASTFGYATPGAGRLTLRNVTRSGWPEVATHRTEHNTRN